MNSERAKILRDAPSSADEFQGEGHKRSAAALAYAVEQFADKDGAIGLEGHWGAGKSTVIRLAETLFEGDASSGKKRHIFSFDLWVHQPELLKLAFLEEFISWAGHEKRKLLPPEKVEPYLEEITDREITTRIENKRQFSSYGIFFILLAPLLPIAYTWLSPLAFGPQSSASASLFSIKGFEVSGLMIAGAVVAALYAVFVSSVLFKLATKWKDGWRAALSAGARMFSKETDFDKITQSIRERNPTNEEFQTFFRKILSEVQRKGDRVVFVFDNIDRLPSDVVSKVWSETRAIFSMQSRRAQPANSGVIAIVPYDAAYVGEVFKGDSDKDSRAEHLIKKTFDISLRVAPPLSTDWRAFLEKKLDESFPAKLPVDEKYKIFKLFDIDHQERKVFPTPRNIISYINEIATMWNQWGDKIPVPHIALYVLQRRFLEKDAGAIKNPATTNTRLARVVGDGAWHRDMAALHFNVEPEHAYQILLGQDIEKLATGTDRDAFVLLTTRPGFAEVFPDTVQQWADQWAKDGGDLIARLARNMSDERIVGVHFHDTWQRVSEAVPQLKACDTAKPEDYVDLALIIENLPASRAETAARQMVAWFSQHLPAVAERNLEVGRKWFPFFEKVYSSVCKSVSAEAGKALITDTSLPEGANFCLAVCGMAAQSEDISFDDFDGGEDGDKIKPAALELVKSDPELLGQIMREDPWFVDEPFWTDVAGRIADRLQAEKLDNKSRLRLATLLSDIRAEHDKKGGGKTRIAQLANDGTLVWHTMRAREAGEALAAAKLIWLILDSTDGAHPPANPGGHPNFGDVNADYQNYTAYVSELGEDGEEAKEIGRLVSESGSFHPWATFANAHPQTKAFASGLRALIANHELGALPTKSVVQEFPNLQRTLGEDLTQTFLAKFTGWVQHFPKHFSGKESLSLPPAFLTTIARTKTQGYEEVGAFVDGYLEGFTEQQWSDLFEARDQAAMEHLLTRIEVGEYRPTSPNYALALMTHTMKVLDGTIEVSSFKDRWAILFDGMPPNTRSKFARDVLVNLDQITTTTQSVEHFLEICSPLAELLPFASKPDLTLDHLVIPLVSSGSEIGRTFVKDHSREFAKCQRESSSDVRGRLEEALQALRQSGADGETRAEEIAKLLDIRLPKAKTDDKEEKAASE